MIRSWLGSVLQVLALVVGSWSAFVLHPSAGGLVLSVGLLLFGLSVERSSEE